MIRVIPSYVPSYDSYDMYMHLLSNMHQCQTLHASCINVIVWHRLSSWLACNVKRHRVKCTSCMLCAATEQRRHSMWFWRRWRHHVSSLSLLQSLLQHLHRAPVPRQAPTIHTTLHHFPRFIVVCRTAVIWVLVWQWLALDLQQSVTVSEYSILSFC